MIHEWASTNQLHLVYDAKDTPSFHSGRWNRGYNPDLCFISENSNRRPLGCNRQVFNAFPNSQHRPVIAQIGLQIPVINSVPKPRWNFRKANWAKFTAQLDDNIRWIPPEIKNYDRFLGIILSTAK